MQLRVVHCTATDFCVTVWGRPSGSQVLLLRCASQFMLPTVPICKDMPLRVGSPSRSSKLQIRRPLWTFPAWLISRQRVDGKEMMETGPHMLYRLAIHHRSSAYCLQSQGGRHGCRIQASVAIICRMFQTAEPVAVREKQRNLLVPEGGRRDREQESIGQSHDCSVRSSGPYTGSTASLWDPYSHRNRSTSLIMLLLRIARPTTGLVR